MTDILIMLLLVAGAGSLGGVINALLSDNGFIMPRAETSGNQTIWRPGVFGNVIIGMVAAIISWGLYGPLAGYVILPSGPADQLKPTLTLSALVGAILVGIGGARWLTNEVDKTLLQKAAAKFAASSPDKEKAVGAATAKPAEAVALAFSL